MFSSSRGDETNHQKTHRPRLRCKTLFACFKELILNPSTEPRKSQVEMMLNSITSDMLAPFVRMSDKGELPIVAAQWAEVSSHIKHQVAAVYFGTHPRLEEIEQ